jgi:oligopeptide/dipeptide ABC transporter ATP-binding protein
MTEISGDNILEIHDLKVYFEVKGGIFHRTVGVVKAVDGVNLSVKRGEILGLVGESGCGKTTIGRAILRLVEPSSGDVYFNQQNVLNLSRKEMKPFRKAMQIVFQDPFSSLDPRSKIGDSVAEGLRAQNAKGGNWRVLLWPFLFVFGLLYGWIIFLMGIRKNKDTEEYTEQVLEALELVGLGKEHMRRFPHEFSGGQRQRIGIARALVLKPDFIVCDEPVSALDVSIQSQVLNLLKDLREELNLTLFFIAHNMSVVEHLCDRVAVMYLGKIVEVAESEELFRNPQHPYTQALMSAIPIPNPKAKRERIILEGDVPSPLNPPKGCRFHTRCREAIDICSQAEPALIDLGENHLCACHLRQPKAEVVAMAIE